MSETKEQKTISPKFIMDTKGGVYRKMRWTAYLSAVEKANKAASKSVSTKISKAIGKPGEKQVKESKKRKREETPKEKQPSKKALTDEWVREKNALAKEELLTEEELKTKSKNSEEKFLKHVKRFIKPKKEGGKIDVESLEKWEQASYYLTEACRRYKMWSGLYESHKDDPDEKRRNSTIQGFEKIKKTCQELFDKAWSIARWMKENDKEGWKKLWEVQSRNYHAEDYTKLQGQADYNRSRTRPPSPINFDEELDDVQQLEKLHQPPAEVIVEKAVEPSGETQEQPAEEHSKEQEEILG